MCNLPECYNSALPWKGLPGKPRKFHEYTHIVWEYKDKLTAFGRVGWVVVARFAVWANYRAIIREFVPPTPEHLRKTEPAQLELF